MDTAITVKPVSEYTCNECGMYVRNICYCITHKGTFIAYYCRECAISLYPECKESVLLQELYYGK